MSPPREVDEVLLQSLALLDRENVPYVIMGGLAVNVWGVTRATFDIDFEIDVSPAKLAALLEAADGAGFFHDECYGKGFTERVGTHPLVVLKRWSGSRAVHIDLFLAETAFLKQVFERAVQVEVEGKRRQVATVADLILFKLLAWRPKDRMDIVNLLAVQGIPEELYLRGQAERLGVASRLAEILQDWRTYGA